MGEHTFLESIKYAVLGYIGSKAFRVFLKTTGLTQEEYFDEIVRTSCVCPECGEKLNQKEL